MEKCPVSVPNRAQPVARDGRCFGVTALAEQQPRRPSLFSHTVKKPGNVNGGFENETLRGVVATRSYEGRNA